MIRIKANKCGYQGFTCRGIPQLESNMFDTTNTFVSDMQAEFEKLPVRIKGMVYTEETIDMGWPEGGPHPEVAELTCRSDTDPESTSTDVSVNQNGLSVEIDGQTYLYPVYGGTSGWSDLFNSHYVDGSTIYFYKEKVWLGVTGTETQYGPIADVTSIPEFIEGTTAYLSGGTEYEMRPGLLEPMLETDFDPIDIDTIPGWEAAIDPLVYNGAVVNGIIPILEDKIANLYNAVNSVITDGSDENLRNLKDSEYTKSECNNFQITLTAGSAVKTVKEEGKETHESSGPELPKISDPPHSQNKRPIRVGDKYVGGEVVAIWKTTTGGQDTWHWVIKDVPNVYAISSGVITYGETTVTVAGKTGIYAPFYAYLTVTGDTTTSYVSIPADELPPGTGPEGMLQDGDTLPSGGTVSNLTSEVVSGKTFYSWEGLHDNAGAISIITDHTSPALSEDQTADPPPGGVGIGGVRVIQGGSNPEDYILYKIYHEDCISEVKEDKEAEVNDAVAGYIDIGGETPAEFLANVVIPYGTESIVIGATAGIVQPVHNIYLFGTSIGKRWQSAVDVPTVEAVYNFIHDQNTFKDGKFPQESALATGSTMYADGSTVAIYGFTGATAIPGTVVVAEDIKTMLVEGRTVTAPDCVPTAQAVVDYIDGLNINAAASTVGIIGFTTNIPEMLLPIPGSTVSPEEGSVQNVQNIFVGSRHSVSSKAVPTVDAVYHFIHGTTVEGMTFSSALATAGTMSYHGVEGTTVTGAEQGVYKVVENIVTLDAEGSASVIGTTTATGYVPDTQAVVTWTSEFIAGYTASGGTMSLSGSPLEEGITGDKAGITTVARNIVVNGETDERTKSPYAVPTVEAVYEFIHGTSTYAGAGILETASALATIGGMTASVDGTTVTADGYIPGTMNVVRELVGATAANGSLWSVNNVVPTADAVVQYIDKLKKVVGATAGTIEISGQTEQWKEPPAQQPTQGAVWVSTEVKVAPEPSLSVEAVPTVKAVYSFVSGYTAAGGTMSLSGSSPVTEGIAGGSAGIVAVARNILVNTDATARAESPYAVPTVEAVFEFIHGTSTYAGAGILETSSALATIGGMTATVNGATADGYIPGTMNVVKEIVGYTNSLGVMESVKDVVPTADAVVSYIDKVNKVAATGGTVYKNEHDNEACVGAIAGIATVTRNIWVDSAHNDRSVSWQAVPTLEAVYNFVHGDTAYAGYASLETADAKATPAAMSLNTTTDVLSFSSTPGVCYLATNIEVRAADGASLDDTLCVVPTVNAVAKYVGSKLFKQAVPGSIAISTATGSSGETIVDVRGLTHAEGIIQTVTNVFRDSAVATPPLSIKVVPTVEAVINFLHNYDLAETATSGSLGAVTRAIAVEGTIETSGTTAAKLAGISSGVYAVPGTCYTVISMLNMRNRTLIKASGYTVGSTSYTIASVVPTVEAVAEYIENYTATIGGFTVSGTGASATEEWISGLTATAGIFQVVNTLNAAPDTGSRPYSTATVPTVAAVKDYVDSIEVIGSTAVVGTLVVNNAGETIADITGTTAAPGAVWTVQNIDRNATYSKRDYSTEAVPTVDAIINYVHCNTVPDVTMDDSKATEVAMVSHGVSTAPTRGTGDPGTFYVASDIKVATVNNVLTTAPGCVPTAQAVVTYVSTAIGAGTAAVIGHLTSTSGADGDTLATISGSSAPTLGSVWVSDNVYAKYQYAWSGKTVPTARAVSKYVSDYVHGSDGYANPNDGVSGTVVVVTSISTTSYPSYQQYEVPSVGALKAYVSGITGSTGGLGYPRWSNLSNYSSGGSITPGHEYKADTNGWLLISNWSSGCASVRLNGNAIGLGSGGGTNGMTWLLPIEKSTTVYVDLDGGTGCIRFDGTMSSTSSRSYSAKRGMTTQTLMKSEGVTKYDPNDPSTLEESEEDELLAKYRDADASYNGSPEDTAVIAAIAVEAEKHKNRIAEEQMTVVEHNKTLVRYSTYSAKCADYVEIMCGSASDAYTEALAEKEKASATEALNIGDNCLSIACDWATAGGDYMDRMSALYDEDVANDYLAEAQVLVDRAGTCYTLAIAENEKLNILGLSGGDFYESTAQRCAREASEWYDRLDEEVQTEEQVYRKTMAIATDACDRAAAACDKATAQQTAARSYVQNMEKPQER